MPKILRQTLSVVSGRRVRSAALIGTGLCHGCAAYQPPERATFTAPDQVSVVASEQIVGTWLTRELNPTSEADEPRTVIQYLPDGRVRADVQQRSTSSEEMFSYQINGRWTLQGSSLIHTGLRFSSRSPLGEDQLLITMLNKAGARLGGSATIYEISTDRIVMIGTDGLAVEYVREH